MFQREKERQTYFRVVAIQCIVTFKVFPVGHDLDDREWSVDIFTYDEELVYTFSREVPNEFQLTLAVIKKRIEKSL